MSIEDYFDSVRCLIEECPAVDTFDIQCNKRHTYEGYLRIRICFVDNSELHVREYVDVEGFIERVLHAYHYMDGQKNTIFRYDNAKHHSHKGLSTYPDHRHKGNKETVEESTAPDLDEVLAEVRKHLRFPR